MKVRQSFQEKALAQAEDNLYQAIAVLQTSLEVRKFFEDLCTPNERQALADRWRVVELLKAGLSYRAIYEKTGVSVTTIGRVARCLLQKEGGYNLVYERLQK